MRDTVYRDEVIEICKRWRRKAIKEQNGEGWYMADILLKFIQRMPSADRPQGENLLEEYPSLFECSICGASCFDTIPWDCNIIFCPNCGARMKGADE